MKKNRKIWILDLWLRLWLGQFANWTFRLLDSSPIRHFAYWSLRPRDTSPTGQFAYWTFRLHLLETSSTQ